MIDDLVDDLDNNVVETNPDFDQAKIAYRADLRNRVFGTSYHDRGFFKDRGFIKDGELVGSIKDVFGLDGTELQTSYGGPVIKDCKGNCLTAVFSYDLHEIEESLRSVLSSGSVGNCKVGDIMSVYVFKPFDEKKVSDVADLPLGLVEFVGKYDFINTFRGWTPLNFSRVVVVPVKNGPSTEN
ncbi:MAG: hypothetical protein K2K55_04855 [Duncaniella sp.]|nr:hypothetical protein [Duncaniella sp.]